MNKSLCDKRRPFATPDSDNLLNLIFEACSKAVRSGIKPWEVWLGPREVAILEKLMDWKNSENAILMGLTIRHMKSEGVRVGNSVRVTMADLEKPKKD